MIPAAICLVALGSIWLTEHLLRPLPADASEEAREGREARLEQMVERAPSLPFPVLALVVAGIAVYEATQGASNWWLWLAAAGLVAVGWRHRRIAADRAAAALAETAPDRG
ncbi:hypothetical protein CLV56_2023 [Mumia flava]|uniref:Uncharacterized protein n=1 Tax=Mumia flava TaxID=1348852 RepID=A0A0B2B6Z6_9ACTN|nr:hypothetical protein [Mumia flava]PJJ57785.1 hypothetical protein CLV56_2023 [Mumia flava]